MLAFGVLQEISEEVITAWLYVVSQKVLEAT
jgi:hypothetical protein